MKKHLIYINYTLYTGDRLDYDIKSLVLHYEMSRDIG